MDRSWGTVRTTRGELTVEREALHHHTTPAKSVTGELARYRDGTWWQRLRAVGGILAVLFLLAGLLYRAWSLTDAPVGLALLFPALAVASTGYQFFETYVRDTRIPRSAVEDLELDPDDRELTIRHTHDDGILPTLGAAPWTETVKLPTDEEVREARTVFRTVGLAEEFDVVEGDDREPANVEYEYHVETRNGVVFCEACDSQVSPADDRCPACDERIRVPESAETA